MILATLWRIDYRDTGKKREREKNHGDAFDVDRSNFVAGGAFGSSLSCQARYLCSGLWRLLFVSLRPLLGEISVI